MCLNLKKGAELQTATKDITVYKQVMQIIYSWGVDEPRMNYQTPYQEMPIEIGETYHSELCRDGNRVDEGLHSFKSAAAAEKDGPGIIVECIIPKGSKYYVGTFYGRVSYASDCIKYIKIHQSLLSYCLQIIHKKILKNT